MKRPLRIILLSALALAAVIAAALLADAWRSARRDSQQLSATLAAQSAQLQQAADREKQRDAQLVSALAAIQTQTRSIHTPQQAAREIPSVLPPLPLPVTIHLPALTTPTPPYPDQQPGAAADPPLYPEHRRGAAADPPLYPEHQRGAAAEPPPATMTIPQPDLQPLYAGLQNCRAAALESETVQRDLSDEKARSALLLRERDAAVATARGGSFFTRLKRSAKWFVIGAAAGAAATAIARH